MDDHIKSWNDILPPLPEQSAESKQDAEVSGMAKLSLTAADATQIEEDPSFSYDGFQIVRGEYFAHINEPSVSICDYKITINNACLRKAPEVTYVQILINPDTKKLVIRPCQEDEKDSFCWCTAKHKPRSVTCRGLFIMLVDRMGWNPDYRYKFLGKMIQSKNEYLFAFDLNGPEIYQRQIITDTKGKEKRTTKRSPIFPDEWKNQFGVSVEEHRKAVQINIFDGYAVFGIKDPKNDEKQHKEDATNETELHT